MYIHKTYTHLDVHRPVSRRITAITQYIHRFRCAYIDTYTHSQCPQVGLATLIQGIAAIAQCIYSGDLVVGPHFVAHLPPRAFWFAAVTGSMLNSVVKTLETKAFAETDMSLCVPFLAFDPVMQFVIGVAVMPMACSYFEFGCDEAGDTGVRACVRACVYIYMYFFCV
jgi:hypothetical protein